MKLRKTLFFEIPSKDFIMPVYTEDDVNTLKSFLREDKVKFSIGYKSTETQDGFYYIGQVKDFTDEFCLGDFPLVYRKRILDVLIGLKASPKFIDIDDKEVVLKKIVYFKINKNGPKAYICDYNEENIKMLSRLDIKSYFLHEFSVLVLNHHFSSDYADDEIFYKIKNPNF